MKRDIREAHIEFARELLKMYDDENEFEEIKARYENIAKGNIPDNIEQIRINENDLNICDLLIKVGFATSKSEAKRMILGNGIKVNGKLVDDYNKIIDLTESRVIQFGKNKFIQTAK